MTQAFKHTGFLMALTLACATLGGMGWFAYAGVSFHTGMGSDVQKVNKHLGHPSAQGTGTGYGGTSYFGIAVGVSKSVRFVWLLATGTKALLASWGAPWPIALAVQTMVDYVIGVSLLGVFRGMNIL